MMPAASLGQTVRQTLRMDDGWRFHRGDVPAPLGNNHLAAYMFNKAGWARGAARGNFDDSDWPTVTVPHDWSLDGPFDPDHHVNSGFLPRGIGWYRRAFALDEADRGKVLKLRFDAIASHAVVYVNGHLLARSFNGYLPIDVDLTDVATYGDELNVVSVRVDATPMEGWWYEGAGIYRHVWLTKHSRTHFVEETLRVVASPVVAGSSSWRLFLMGEIVNAGASRADVAVICGLYDPQGEFITKASIDCFAPRHGSTRFMHELVVNDPQLWSLDLPYRYRLTCDLVWDRHTLDTADVRFGFRTIHFDAGADFSQIERVPQVGDIPQTRAERANGSTGLGVPRPVAPGATRTESAHDRSGFYLNGRRVLLKGTCYHQDHAGVGVALPDSVHRFRVQRLKDMGSNAVRIGHHPPAPEFLDACDELGMLVMDENRSFGSTAEHLGQLRQMMRRDTNHPSVILWSICNEESIQGTPVARNIAATMARAVKQLDFTRPTTAAISGGILNDNAMSETIDVMSINYSFATLDPFHAKWPNKPVLSSETGCTLSTRGTYVTDPAKFEFASYDEDHAPWGSTARQAWREITSRPWMAGLFVWTGFDYRGEPSPHAWPSVTSHWGLMDLCGFEKDAFWRHKAYFSNDPVLHLTPHWNWAGVAPAKTVRVQALTNCDTIELWLNDRSLGRQNIDPIEMAEWQVPFEPGTLRAVGSRGGEKVATFVVETTGPAVGLGVELHPSCDAAFVADGETAWPLTIYAIDADGRRVPDAEPPVTITVDGPAALLGVGNGDPNSHAPNRGPALPLFRGLAQAIVQATTVAGRVTVRVIAPGLADGVLSFDTAAVTPRPAVPPATRRHLLTDWLMGPITPTPPDVSAAAAGTDMNTWERIKAGGPQMWTEGGYRLYRATLKPPKRLANVDAMLVFHRIDGVTDVFIDGVAAVAAASGGGTVVVRLPTRTTPADIVVRLHGAAGDGLNGAVEITFE